MERREKGMGQRPSDDAAASNERMRSRLTRGVNAPPAPLSNVSEATEGLSDILPKKSSPPVGPKRASLGDRITRRPSMQNMQNQPRPSFDTSNMPPAPQLPPSALGRRRQTMPPAPRARPPVPSRERKPIVMPRRQSMSRHHPDSHLSHHPDNHHINHLNMHPGSESELSSNLSTDTQVTSVFDSDSPPKPTERRIVRRSAPLRKTVVNTRPARSMVAAPARRTIHIQVQSQKAPSEPSDDAAAAEYRDEIKRLKQELKDLRDDQSGSAQGLEDALDRLSLVTLEREEVRRSSDREKRTLESLKKEVEDRSKTITNLKAMLEDREGTLDDLVEKFDARAREVDGLRASVEEREGSLDEVKAILANRESTIKALGSEKEMVMKEKEDFLKINDDLLAKIQGFGEEKGKLVEEMDGLKGEKEVWVLEREKFTLETASLRDGKSEAEAKCEELTKEIGTRLAVRSEQEDFLISRVAALEIINESVDAQLDRLTSRVAEGQTEIEGLKEAKAGLEGELEKVSARAEKLEEEKGALEEAKKELEAAKEGLEGAKAELEEVKEGLEKAKAGLEEEKGKLEARVGELEGEIDGLKTKVEGLEEEKKDKEEEIKTLTAERNALEKQSDDQEEELEELKAGGATTTADLEKLRESEEAARAELETLKESEGAAKAELEKLRAEKEELEGADNAADAADEKSEDGTTDDPEPEPEAEAAPEAEPAEPEPAEPDAPPAPPPADDAALQGLQKENDDLKQKNTELQEQVGKITASLEEQSTKATEATTKLEEESARLADEAKKIEEETARIESELKKIEEETKKIEEESKRLEGEAGKVEEQSKRVAELQTENETLASQLGGTTAQVDELTSKHEAELVAMRAQIQRLSRVTTRSKSPKKRGKDEMVIVRNPHDRSLLQVMRKSKALSSQLSSRASSVQSSDNDD